MKHHVNRVTSNCFFQLHRLRQIRRVAGPKVTKRLVSAFVLSRLDYCNAALAGLPKTMLRPLQRALNAAARLVANNGSHDDIAPACNEGTALASIQPALQKQAVSNDAFHSHTAVS